MIRLFIAVNLPPAIKNKLAEKLISIKNKCRSAGIRFTLPEQWHLTLIFLGYQNEADLETIKSVLRDSAAVILKPVNVEFDKIIYGPPGPRARMIWLTASEGTSAALNEIKKIIEDGLLKAGVKWERENRPFRGHLTLARFEMAALKNLPPLDYDFKESFEAKTIDLMKSTLRREGALYQNLFSV